MGLERVSLLLTQLSRACSDDALVRIQRIERELDLVRRALRP